MKKSIVLFVVMVGVAVLAYAASEEVQVYEYLYYSTDTKSGQLDILQNMAQQKLSGAGEFYAKALRKLVSEYSSVRGVTEKNAADEQAILLSALLGAEKYSDAAADLWLVADGFSAPLVKAEALMALGKIRATTYLPQVIRVLDSLNNSPTSDRLNGERVAFGAIISLEKFQDPSGYLPVFFASTGWYSDRIKSQASKSLPFIATDPTPFMMEVVKGAGYNYSTKLNALKTIEAAKIDNKDKANVAVAALAEGWRASTKDPEMIRILGTMRLLAISMINRYKPSDDAIYPLLERSYTEGFDTQEKLDAVSALASQATDEAARRLSRFLMDLNNKRLSDNIRQEDERMVRAVIPALGQTGRPLARPALNAVHNSNWTPAVKSLADNAMKQIR